MIVLLGGRFSAVPKVEFEENNFLLSSLGWPVNISHSTKRKQKQLLKSGFWENGGFRDLSTSTFSCGKTYSC